ncbi:MAG: histidine phosphatase family protein [Anaerolineae bacterium]
MRLHIIRHADPDYENDTLTPAGKQEAAALAKRLASYRLDSIFSSPMPRAHMTAQYTADLLKLPVIIEPWAIEVQGWSYDPIVEDGEAIPVWDIPGEILRANPAYFDLERWCYTPPLDSQRIRDDYAALSAAVDRLVARYGYQREGRRYRITEHNQQQIALFCHNGTALAALAHLLCAPPPLIWCSFWHAPSAVTTILFEERGDEWAVPRAISVGDVSHLYEARLPVQPRGIRGNYY